MNIKTVAVRTTALLLFFAVIAAIVLYQAGFYEVAFLKRPAPPASLPQESETGGQTLPDQTDPPGTTAPPPETDPPLPPETAVGSEDAGKLLQQILSLTEMQKAGYRRTSEKFKASSFLARLDFDFGSLQNTFSARKETVSRTVVYQKSNGLYETKVVKETRNSPAARLYYGLIFLEAKKKISVYNADGECLIDSFTGTLVYARSVSGKPVVKIGDEYREIDAVTGLSKAIPEEAVDFKALRFDSPADYAENKENLFPFCEYVDVYTEVTPEEQTTEPGSTDPESGPASDPGTTAPDGSGASPSDPETTEPDSSDKTPPEPESTEPDSSNVTPPEPESTEPDSSDVTPPDPESTEPDSSDVTPPEPESTEPDSSDPVSPDPETTVPDASEPEPANPEPADSSSDFSDSSEAPVEPSSFLYKNAASAFALEKEESASGDASESTVEIDGKFYTVETLLMFGYRDGEGNTVIEPQFKTAYTFSEGLAAVTDFEDRLFFINTSGKEVVSLRNQELIRPADMNRATVRQQYLAAPDVDASYLGMYYYDGGYVMVRYVYRGETHTERLYKNENRLVDKTGKTFAVPGGYSLVNYSDGILLLEKEGRYGYMDTAGGWVRPAVYTEASPFLGGLAVVGSADGKYGLIDTEGNAVLPLFFDYVSQVSDGLVCTFEESRGWEIYCVTEPDRGG